MRDVYSVADLYSWLAQGFGNCGIITRDSIFPLFSIKWLISGTARDEMLSIGWKCRTLIRGSEDIRFGLDYFHDICFSKEEL